MTVYGYARVSTAGQSLYEQKETLKNAGAEMISVKNIQVQLHTQQH